MQFEPEFRYQGQDDEPPFWLLFLGDQILISEEKGHYGLPKIALNAMHNELTNKQYLGRLNGHPCYTGELKSDQYVPKGLNVYEFRQFLRQSGDDWFALASKAYQLLHWDRTHRYCSRCGSEMEDKSDERAKLCPACGFVDYPRISPAMIVVITKDDEILLARGTRFQYNFYSTLAGFVEPGETFEQCVQREVMEEVGLKIKNIRYFGSQPWPFPDSLMVGFTAEYESGEIQINPEEIVDAGWFRAGQMPPVPKPGSISRELIDWFIVHHQ